MGLVLLLLLWQMRVTIHLWMRAVKFSRDFVQGCCSTLPANKTLSLGWLVLSILFYLSCQKASALDVWNSCLRSINDRKWIAKEDRGRVKDCYLEFVDNLRYLNIDEVGNGPKVDEMIQILSWCPELKRRKHTLILLMLASLACTRALCWFGVTEQ